MAYDCMKDFQVPTVIPRIAYKKTMTSKGNRAERETMCQVCSKLDQSLAVHFLILPMWNCRYYP
jgi:hypothetical protein